MSQINPFNINGNFPVAGQDNDSQGFRDNFTNTRNNLNITKSEIEDLQSKVLLKLPLDGQLDSDSDYNNLNGTVLTAPALKSWRNTKVAKSGASIDIDFSQGNAVTATVTQNVTVSISNVPSDSYCTIRVAFAVDGPRVVTLPLNIEGAADIQGYNANDNSIEFDAQGVYLYELSSYDGSTFYINDLSRARNAFVTTNISSVMNLEPLSEEPVGAVAGTIAVAIGTVSWNPAGSATGKPYPVFYDGTAWQNMI
jgi:hypothetical protein